jgi:multisubunit Na+/H+ antiporter MnhE subunit
MKSFGLKVCLFLFLAALFSGRTNALGTVTGALTGTILLWPLYRKLTPQTRHRKEAAEEDPVRSSAE